MLRRKKEKEITMNVKTLEWLIKHWTWTENEDLTLPEARDMLEAIVSYFMTDDINKVLASRTIRRWRAERIAEEEAEDEEEVF